MEVFEIVILAVLGVLNLCGEALFQTGTRGRKMFANQKGMWAGLSVAFLFVGVANLLIEGPNRLAAWIKARKNK